MPIGWTNRGKKINVRVIILGIESPMLDGEGLVVNFAVFDPVVGGTVIEL
jgi:hypothetical protein